MRKLLLAAVVPAGLVLAVGLSAPASAATVSEAGLHATTQGLVQNVGYYYHHRHYRHRRWDRRHRRWHYYN